MTVLDSDEVVFLKERFYNFAIHHLGFITVVGVTLFLAAVSKMFSSFRAGRYTKFVSMKNKTVIVTGANSGIGLPTACEIAKMGARTILACRDETRGRNAVDEIVRLSKNDNVLFRQLDLASFNSVREFARDVIQNEERVDVLINNAGILGLVEREVTEDGCEKTMQVNYLSHFLLTTLLLDKLKSSSPSRVVNLTSMMYKHQQLDLEDLQSCQKYIFNAAYNNSKFANVLFTRELARRLENTGVTANCVHPGVVTTNLSRDATGIIKFIINMLYFFIGKSPELGAQTSIYAAVAPELEKTSGRYFSDCQEERLAPFALDEVKAKQLWQQSEQIVSRNQ